MQDRRHFLKHMAGMSAIAAPGAQFLSQIAQAAPEMKKKHKSLIILWMGGGPATIDLWDLKPGSPNGGEFKEIQTAAPGVKISEHLPTIAKQFKNLSIIRSLRTTEGDHNRGTQLMNTGRTPSPVVSFPSIGSVASLKLAPKELDLPAFISMGGAGPGVGPGFLGMNYAPFSIQNPGSKPENIGAPEGISEERMSRREKLFSGIEKGFNDSLRASPKGETLAAAQAHTDVYNKALSLVVSQRKDVFDLSKEPRALVDEYGGNNNFARGCLMARKLVEAGAVTVEVGLGGWDMHQNIHNTLATRQLPMMDKAMGTLVRDLTDRGLIQDTVILWMGEFGRTPRINQNAGRDHWPNCWSVVVGGGNIKGGVAYGSTDKDGMSVSDNPMSISDVFALVYHGLGIDPKVESNASVRDNLGRPFAIAGDKFNLPKELIK